MFDTILHTLEITFYVFLVFLPIIIFIQLLIRLKNKFYDLKAWEFELGQETVLYEIKSPKEIFKTPEAMEIVLSSLVQTGGEGNWFSKSWSGKSRAKYSLEIASIDGNVRFYILTRKSLSKLVESAFYAQYPTIEMNQVPDYTKYFSYEKEAAGGFFGFEAKLNKPDPLPIKTYKKFGLDKPGLKAEEVIDPISYFIETLGNIGEGENFWMQIVIKAQKKDYLKEKPFWKRIFGIGKDEYYDWKDIAKEEIEKIKEDLMEENADGIKFQKVSTDREKEVISSIIDNINKPSYWTGVRIIYFSEDGKFDAGNINPTLAFFQPLTSIDFNNLGYGFHTGFDYTWQDPSGKRTEELRRTMFGDFKRRKFFEASNQEKKVWQHNGKRYNTFVMSTEELATIFHPPTATTATPTFERIDSKKGEAPMNLPI